MKVRATTVANAQLGISIDFHPDGSNRLAVYKYVSLVEAEALIGELRTAINQRRRFEESGMPADGGGK